MAIVKSYDDESKPCLQLSDAFGASGGQLGSNSFLDADNGKMCGSGQGRWGEMLWPNASRAPVTRVDAWRTTFSSLAKSPGMQRTPRASMRSMSASMGAARSAA